MLQRICRNGSSGRERNSGAGGMARHESIWVSSAPRVAQGHSYRGGQAAWEWRITRSARSSWRVWMPGSGWVRLGFSRRIRSALAAMFQFWMVSALRLRVHW